MMKMNGDKKEMEMEMTLQKMDMKRVMYDEFSNPTIQNQHDNTEKVNGAEASNMMEMQVMNMA